MELNFGNVADWQVALLAAWSVIARWDTRYVPGQKGFDYTYSFAGSSCLSEVRYAYVFRQRKQTPEYRTYGGTYAWARASLRATRRLEKYADREARRNLPPGQKTRNWCDSRNPSTRFSTGQPESGSGITGKSSRFMNLKSL